MAAKALQRRDKAVGIFERGRFLQSGDLGEASPFAQERIDGCHRFGQFASEPREIGRLKIERAGAAERMRLGWARATQRLGIGGQRRASPVAIWLVEGVQPLQRDAGRGCAFADEADDLGYGAKWCIACRGQGIV